MNFLSWKFVGSFCFILFLIGGWILYSSCQARWGAPLILPLGMLGLLSVGSAVAILIVFCGYSDRKNNRINSEFVNQTENRIKGGLPFVLVAAVIYLLLKIIHIL